MRLSQDFLITYKLRERPVGGLSKSFLRKLKRRNLDSNRHQPYCAAAALLATTTLLAAVITAFLNAPSMVTAKL